MWMDICISRGRAKKRLTDGVKDDMSQIELSAQMTADQREMEEEYT